MFCFMKKIVYLCTLVLLSLNVMAQIDLNDRNWECVLNDDFSETNRQFNSAFQESLGKWIAYSKCLQSGVTKPYLYNIYQWRNNTFNPSDGTLLLNGFHTGLLHCGAPMYYEIPPEKTCQTSHGPLYYNTGMIESPTIAYRYGYYEIRCKLPVHRGAFPAFWLWDAKCDTEDTYYEEIDIFEYNWDISQQEDLTFLSQPNPYVFATGIYYDDMNCIRPIEGIARNHPRLPDNGPDLSGWHTFSCEWMPDHVIWYCDGNVVNECYDIPNIPRRNLTLIANYAIDWNCSIGNDNMWMGSDNMVIDYINVYQLKWDCDTDEAITRQSDLDNFDFSVKKSINITASHEEVVVNDTDKTTFRATDSVIISGPFHTENGCEFTVLTQICPCE